MKAANNKGVPSYRCVHSTILRPPPPHHLPTYVHMCITNNIDGKFQGELESSVRTGKLSAKVQKLMVQRWTDTFFGQQT